MSPGAMALESIARNTRGFFDERIHAARPHPGQVEVAAHLRELLRDSEIRKSHLENDRASRTPTACVACAGARRCTRRARAPCARLVETETGSATDNPLVFSETGEVLIRREFPRRATRSVVRLRRCGSDRFDEYQRAADRSAGQS